MGLPKVGMVKLNTPIIALLALSCIAPSIVDLRKLNISFSEEKYHMLMTFSQKIATHVDHNDSPCAS
jgi:hypothetical protein